ncbi:unnamed protein product [Adineta ricciae]|uniref:Uncharacterized protein n=1 Tax=Adineta ricciae TaxID=249248 RepID=A0A815X799_ADIRI|nr:unnamed protein product [Adineta ricciae]CAF1552626.1 unnamed protein product [Adineta ricciae]
MFDYIRCLPTKVFKLLSTLNLFSTQQQDTETTDDFEQGRILTRCFILILILCSIIAGIYIVFPYQDHLITVESPSEQTYKKLYEKYSSTLQCPCSQISVPYGTFLNLTFVLHQICSSTLVSSTWLKYLALFDPNNVPIWTKTDFSRDFRSYGVSYFQFLSMFCSLVETNIADAQHLFNSTQYINEYLPSQTLFRRENQYITDSFIIKIRNDFARISKWVHIGNVASRLLTSVNMNFRIKFHNDGQVDAQDIRFSLASMITRLFYTTKGKCSCASQIQNCFLKAIIYSNGTQALEFLQIFNELKIGCIPIVGFLRSEIDWWYNSTYIENIRTTYKLAIDFEPFPNIQPLNLSILTRFRGIEITKLVDEMFIERIINENDQFDLFYEQCAPIACSYKIIKRRDITVAILLLITVCSGINQGLRLVIPLMGKFILFLIRRQTNRNIFSSSDYGMF